MAELVCVGLRADHFTTYFSVQVSVAMNAWYGPYFDLVQQALAKTAPVTAEQLYVGLVGVSGILFFAITIGVLNLFFVSHYIFRWRTAMNEFYMANWDRLRHIEGASQRVQGRHNALFQHRRRSGRRSGSGYHDADRVSSGPVYVLGDYHRTSDCWRNSSRARLGRHCLVAVRYRFSRARRYQASWPRVSQSARGSGVSKELVYGEDHEDRARPATVAELFSNVRKNYFRLYFHYMYFNVARIFYLQADNLYSLIVLIPSIAAGKITLGVFTQIGNVFDQVRGSFQYLINSWTTIVELLSIYKRLKAFEAAIDDKPLPEIDQRYLKREAEDGELAANKPT